MRIISISRLVKIFLLYRKRCQTIRRLNALSDQMLKDIGIERNQIHTATNALAAKEKEKLDALEKKTTGSLKECKVPRTRCAKPI